MIALVRHADDPVTQPEREEQLGRVGHEADDPHGAERRPTTWTVRTVATEAGEVEALVRDIAVKDFAAAIWLVDRVAELAQARNHHPDILVHGYNRVRLTLWTHTAGGVTAADHELAAAVDAL